MIRENDDLLPLFVGEARERLERIAALLDDDPADPKQMRLLQRELHALKGASRMMGLIEISEMCHQAEELVTPSAGGGEGDLVTVVDQIQRAVGEQEEPRPAADQRDLSAVTPGESVTSEHLQRAPQTDTEMRVGTMDLDALTERAARLRIQNLAIDGIADRINQLAYFAEQGLQERNPSHVLSTLASMLEHLGVELDAAQWSMQRQADQQLESLLDLQIQPLVPFLRSLARHARELAQSLGKNLDVTVEAGDSRLDRRIVDALREALVHLVRNAVDHGLEETPERTRSGKAESGRVCLQASTGADRVRIVVSDDGRGIDPVELVAAAREQGLVSAEEAESLSDEQALQLMFLSGFSTREKASHVSGRGIGLDAVAAAVRGVGGDLWVTSNVGHGTTVTVEVPAASRGERVVVVRAGQTQVALPSAMITGYRRMPAPVVQGDHAGRANSAHDGEAMVAPVSLAQALGESTADSNVVVDGVVGGARVALAVDGVLHEEEVLLRPLAAVAGAPTFLDGVCVLGSGRPVAVVDPRRLFSIIDPLRAAADRGRGRAAVRVLLVDDSRVTREMVRRVLEDAGFVVMPASSGDDALEVAEGGEIDCVVTDIEMPGMDGLELTRCLRSDPATAHLPVVVISTLNRPQDRLAGLEAGADAYLTKQDLDIKELTGLVERMARQS